MRIMQTVPEFLRIAKEAANPQLDRNKGRSFLPHNIYAITAEDSDELRKIRYELSVAGYSKDELEVKVTSHGSFSQLRITGQKKDTEESNSQWISVHKGIASRVFVTTYDIPKQYVIDAVKLKDGILTIDISIPAPKSDDSVYEITQL